MRTLPLTNVLGSLFIDLNKTQLTEQDDEDILAGANAIYSKLRWALELHAWPELANAPVELPCTDGLVTWDNLKDPIHWEFYNANPFALSTDVRELEAREDSQGLRVDSEESTVWARLWPRVPVFDPRIGLDVSTEAPHMSNVVFYRTTDKTFYQLIAEDTGTLYSTFADTAKWSPRPTIPWVVAEAVKLAANGYLLGNSEQERAQAAVLQKDANRILEDAWMRIVNS